MHHMPIDYPDILTLAPRFATWRVHYVLHLYWTWSVTGRFVSYEMNCLDYWAVQRQDICTSGFSSFEIFLIKLSLMMIPRYCSMLFVLCISHKEFTSLLWDCQRYHFFTQMCLKQYSLITVFKVGLQDMNFSKPIQITDNYLLVMVGIEKITNNFMYVL